MKIIRNTIIFIILLLPFTSLTVFAKPLIQVKTNNDTSIDNLNTSISKDENNIQNEHLDKLKDGFDVVDLGERGIKQTLINIAKSLKNIFFIIAGLYFLILVLKLLFTDNTDEEVGKFKKGILWISVGLMITQISYSFVKVLFDKNIGTGLAYNFIKDIIDPLIKLLETGASFLFLAVLIYAFFKLVTANGDEEAAKSGKITILYSIIGFIVVKISAKLVETIYGEIDLKILGGVVRKDAELDKTLEIIFNIIHWANGFIGIIVIILIIYTGTQVMFSNGDEEVLVKSKKSIIYIILGIFLLFINYLILTFFIIPEVAIN